MSRLFLLFALLFPQIIFSQKESDFIKWEEGRKLTWKDFKAAPQAYGNTAALTTTHLGFSYSMKNGKVTYAIVCEFEKEKSWGLVKNDWILKHEQGHFDIAEIYARRLNQQLSIYQFNKETFQKDLDSIYKSVIKEKEKYQQEYDDETNYSINKPKQEEWLKKISEKLLEYKPWSGY